MGSSKDFLDGIFEDLGLCYTYTFKRVTPKTVDMDMNSPTFQQLIGGSSEEYTATVSIQDPDSGKNKGQIAEFTDRGISVDSLLLVYSPDEICINDEFTWQNKEYHIIKVSTPELGNDSGSPEIMHYACVAQTKKNQKP